MIRTLFEVEAANIPNVNGTRIVRRRVGRARVTDVKLSAEGAAAVGREVGRYITIEGDPYEHAVQMVLEKALDQFLPRKGLMLVAGLGNPELARDSLGSQCVAGLMPCCGARRSVVAVETDIKAKTGIETARMIRGVAAEMKVAAVVAVDALACSDPLSIGKTVQLSDTGMTPGSAVGTDSLMLTREYIGVPVIALGVPMVTVLNDITGVPLHKQYLVAPAGEGLYSKAWGECISAALNGIVK